MFTISKRVKIASKEESGFSLVELMIASFLGMVVVLLVVEVMLGLVRSARLQDGLAEINEAGLFIFDFIRRDIQMAGFSGDLFMKSIEPLDWAGTSDDGGRFDTLILKRRLSKDRDTDCLGETVPAERLGKIILSRYYVDKVPGDGDLFELRCELSLLEAGVKKRVKSTALIAGVESFQVQLGVVSKQVDPGVPADVAFLTIDNVDPVVDQVVAVRLALLLQSSNGSPLGKVAENVENVQVLEHLYGGTDSVIDLSDGHLRRLYQTTITLKNGIF